jgi:hypothetical protein
MDALATEATPAEMPDVPVYLKKSR